MRVRLRGGDLELLSGSEGRGTRPKWRSRRGKGSWVSGADDSRRRITMLHPPPADGGSFAQAPVI